MKAKILILLITLFISLALKATNDIDSMYIHFTANDGNDSIVAHPITDIDSIVYYAPTTVVDKCDSLDFSDRVYAGNTAITYNTTVAYVNPETNKTEYSRVFEGETITTNLHGDIWIEVAKPELDYAISKELADFLMLELAYTIDTLTTLAEDGSLSYISYKELIDMGYTSNFCFEQENSYIFKTGIYKIIPGYPGAGNRYYATCEYEFFMFMSRFYNGCNSLGASYNPYPDEFE